MTSPDQVTRTAETTRISDTALIFEGGGMRASLTSGMVVTLLQAGLAFDWVAGISAGSSNAVNYLSGDARRARRSFVDFAADEQFGGLRYFARGQGMFNAEYIYQQAGGPDQALPFDWESFQSSTGDMRIIAFDAVTGDDVVWSRKDTPHIEDLMIRVRASSTMPGLMPPVHLDGHVYVDGAMGQDGGIALSQAQREGFEKFVIVLTQERSYSKAPQRFSAFYRGLFRRYPALGEALLTRWKRYNETRERIFALEAEGKAHVFAPERMPVDNGTRDLSRLAAAHRMGLSQSRRELPAMREFVGVNEAGAV
ncbi:MULTISPECIES: patatin family protein [Brevibacterium]|uniref:Predicted phospholipase, patatin/cPLA2 family n=1 Tax=Brevibacterium antiquum CNRZ 918 TaxID=1255637 RepID=A0A2H1KXW6_9MICO|nr:MULTISPECIES: patatin family protein [Brevibacterium]SMY04570.1 Predicted phospholipase, patatin/cPLA2 family [Brevibacterium antiquum CNRZ 918]HCG56503.1 patatin family protein [Brevibacterium sp.]